MDQTVEPIAKQSSSSTAEPMLEVVGLSVEFRGRRHVTRAVRDLSYSAYAGRTLAIVGESGSGKSVSAQAIMGLLNNPSAFVSVKAVRVAGREVQHLGREARRKMLGDEMSMVYQNASLNPSFTVGWQIAEVFRIHRRLSRREANQRAIDLLARVGIPSPAERARQYPHQFSGGMRQRVAIAMAIALTPKVLIADEPTTALDVTVQAQILDLLQELQDETGMALVLVTHDLAVAQEVADDLVVMYAGRVVESGTAKHVLNSPSHPYTLGLVRAAPQEGGSGRLQVIPGSPPDLALLPAGCAFHPRCHAARAECQVNEPESRELEPGRTVACHFAEEIRFGG